MRLYWIILVLACTACARPYRGFVLEGKISGAAPEKLILNYVDSLGQNIADTAMVENGRFCFRGGINEPTQGILSTGEELRSFDDRHYVRIWLEPSVMNYEAVGNDLQTYTMAGSVTDSDAQELARRLEPVTVRMKALNADYYKPGVNRDSLGKLMEPLQQEYERVQYSFLDTRPDSYIAPTILKFYSGRMKVDELQGYYDRWTEQVKQSAAGREIAGEIRNLRAGSPGAVAALFSATDINGNTFNLADLRGKCVLLDFWASWCKPCRASNPHLKALYKKYGSKGLEVVCVSDDDSDPAKWREAVKQDGIGAFHHVLRGFKWKEGQQPDRSRDISEKYGIHSLPTKILINREGVVIGRYGGGGGTEEEMDDKLEEVFGF